MKSLYEQERELFARHADVADGKYISADRAEQLLGKDAVQYAVNAADQLRFPAKDVNYAGTVTVRVLTLDGFSNAFTFFRMMEIKEGHYNAYHTPDYLSRPEFAAGLGVTGTKKRVVHVCKD